MRGQISIFEGTEESMLNKSIKLIQDFDEVALQRNPRGFVVGYSGGKDSDVLVHLFKRAGVRFCVVHNHTTLDAPETVYYIRRKFYEWELQGIPCKIYPPKKSFWALCREKKILPLRQVRFCCAELKERDIPELRFALRSFGVRKAESVKRALYRDSIETRNRMDYKDNQMFHFDNTNDVKQTGACYTNNYFFVNPLAYWSDDYLWDYIGGERVEVNPLYKCVRSRIGCISCPMSSIECRKQDLKDYPRYGKLFLNLANDIIQIRTVQGLPNKYNYKTGAEYFDMWLNGVSLSKSDEYDLFDYADENNF